MDVLLQWENTPWCLAVPHILYYFAVVVVVPMEPVFAVVEHLGKSAAAVTEPVDSAICHLRLTIREKNIHIKI